MEKTRFHQMRRKIRSLIYYDAGGHGRNTRQAFSWGDQQPQKLGGHQAGA